MAKNVINVKILGDNSGFRRALGDTESRLGSFAKSAGKGLAIAGGALTATTAAAIRFGPPILDAGAKLDAIAVKSSTVFGDSLGDVEAWADGVAASMGLTETQLIGAAAGLGDLLKPMGFTESQAADMSKEMLDLSGALSAWSAGQYDAAEVGDILAKAMLGEREQLKSLGISITEADVQARLAAKGQDELTGAALAQAKALATQELIMEKSTDAQTAWADGSQDALKEQNKAKAGIEELKETLLRAAVPALQEMIPHLTRLAEWLGEVLPPIIQRLKLWFEENWPAIQRTISQVVEWLRNDAWPVISQIIEAVRAGFEVLVARVREYWPSIQETIEGVIGAIQVIIETVIAAVEVVWSRWGEEITKLTKTYFETVKEIIEGVLKVIQGIIDTVTAIIRGDWDAAWGGIKRTIEGVWIAIRGIVEGAVGAIKTILSSAWGAITGAAASAWNGIKQLVSDAIDGVVGLVAGLPGRFLNLLASLYAAGRNLGKSIISGLVSGLKDVTSFAADLAASLISSVKGGINSAINALNDAIPNKLGAGPFSINLPDNPIPTLHSGGPVGSLFGPARDVPIIAQQGEYVLSRDAVRDLLEGGGRAPVELRVGPVYGTPDDRWVAQLVDRIDVVMAGRL